MIISVTEYGMDAGMILSDSGRPIPPNQLDAYVDIGGGLDDDLWDAPIQ